MWALSPRSLLFVCSLSAFWSLEGVRSALSLYFHPMISGPFAIFVIIVASRSYQVDVSNYISNAHIFASSAISFFALLPLSIQDSIHLSYYYR